MAENNVNWSLIEWMSNYQHSLADIVEENDIVDKEEADIHKAAFDELMAIYKLQEHDKNRALELKKLEIENKKLDIEIKQAEIDSLKASNEKVKIIWRTVAGITIPLAIAIIGGIVKCYCVRLGSMTELATGGMISSTTLKNGLRGLDVKDTLMSNIVDLI